MVGQEPFHSLRICLLCTEAGSAVDGHVMAFARSAPTNADQESFACSSAHDSHDDGANDDSCDVSAGRSLQAASDAASASSSLTPGRLPQASSAQQPIQDLVHLHCWGAGFAGGSGDCAFVRACVCACLCVRACVRACVRVRPSLCTAGA